MRIPPAPPQTHFESVCYTAKARWTRKGSTKRNPSTIAGSNPVKCVYDGGELGSTGAESKWRQIGWSRKDQTKLKANNYVAPKAYALAA